MSIYYARVSNGRSTARMIEARKIARVLGGKAVLGRNVGTAMDLDVIVRQGLPKKALYHVVSRIVADPRKRDSLVYLVASRATIQRDGKRLGPLHSDRTERLAALVAIAEEIWGDLDDAREWLTTPHSELDGRTPFRAALTDVGARVAEEVLMRGAHGLPA